MGPKREFITGISVRTGLKKSTVRDLLKSGWTYSWGTREVPVWISPQSRFVEPPTVGPKGPAGNSGVVS